MKLIDPSYKIIPQEDGLQGLFRHIELCGRTCYKSEDKITEDSAEKFVQRMIDSKHIAMLEHGSVYLYFRHDDKDGVDLGDPYNISLNLLFNKYTTHKTNFDTHESFYTTNLRVLVENFPDDWRGILEEHMVPYDERFEFRPTVKLTTSLHVYKDLTRHRSASFAIESTRYCNYSKDKFGKELTFIAPIWCDFNKPFTKTPENEDVFRKHLEEVERVYLDLVEHGWQAQQAAEVLPQCIKGDMIITSTVSHWKFIFDLRAKGTTGEPHPEVKRIMEPLMNEFIDRKWIWKQ